MKNIIAIATAAVALTFSMAAHADFNGKITAVQADNNDQGENLGFKITPATGVTLPACANGVYANGFIYMAGGGATSSGTEVRRNFTADAVLAAYNGAKNVRFITSSLGLICDAKGRLLIQGVILQ